MMGTLILSQPAFVIHRNSANGCLGKFNGKNNNGSSIGLCNAFKIGITDKIESERVRIVNNLAIESTIQACSRDGSCGGERDESVLKQSLLANSSEIEHSIRFSKRQFMKAGGMAAFWSVAKPSIAVEVTKENGGSSTGQSDSSSTGSDSATDAEQSVPKKSKFSGLVNTQSWYRFRGDGFSLRVPPDFEDVMEPEDYSAGSSLYGERAKPKTFAARFASPDRSEVLSVVIRPSNQLKLSFFEAKDVTNLGSLREAASLFVPGGATLFAARTIKIKDSEVTRTYYFYEFSIQDNHVALEAAVADGRAFVVGATAPQSKWEDDGSMLRSAAISFSLL